MKNTKKGGVVLWAVIIVIIVVALGIYWLLPSKKSEKSADSVATTTDVVASSTIKASLSIPNMTVNWKTFTDTQAHLAFKYPATWTAPVKSILGTRYLLDFKNGLTFEVGQFYNEKATKVLTIPELISDLSSAVYKVGPANRKVVVENIKLGGKLATKVTFTQTSDSQNQTKIFIPGRTLTDIIVISDRNNLITNSILNLLLGTISLK